jgi:hypothetical protein
MTDVSGERSKNLLIECAVLFILLMVVVFAIVDFATGGQQGVHGSAVTDSKEESKVVMLGFARLSYLLLIFGAGLVLAVKTVEFFGKGKY